MPLPQLRLLGLAMTFTVGLVACDSMTTVGNGGGSSSGGSSSGGASSGSSSSGASSSDASSSGSSSGASSSGGASDAGDDGATAGGGGEAGAPCASPASCPGAAPICCATIPNTGGSIPNCTTGPTTTACDTSAQCATKLQFSCSGSNVVRLCTQSSDCTEASYNACCTFPGDGGSISFCANSGVAGPGGGTCK